MSPSKHVVASLPNHPRFTSKDVNASEVVHRWLSSLEEVLRTQAFDRLSTDLFHADSWWRDHLALQWDLRTIHTAKDIEAFVRTNQPIAQLSTFRIQTEGKYVPHVESPENQLDWVASMFSFETAVGRGSGVVRLFPDEQKRWKAYAVYTSLQELKCAEEPLGPKRVYGTLDSMPGGSKGGTWLERRQKAVLFTEAEPAVLIVGAGEFMRTVN